MIDWRSILAEHGSAVWRTAYRLLNNHADATDCCQETFLAAWQFAQSEPIRDWAAFLANLATKRAIDELRRRYRSQSRFLEIANVPEPASEAGCPLQQARTAELMDHVRRLMAELPDKQSEVFWLSCIEELSNQHISDRLQLSAGEVRVLLHRARKHLHARLDPRELNKKEIS